nr:2-iminoacetate synthase ThiH [uncultured Holophaga sp.]
MAGLSRLRIEDCGELFADDDPQLLENLAQEAQRLTRRQFGRTISLFAPLYISNHCQNACLYCGFRALAGIQRQKLDQAGIDRECRALAGMGIQSCLLLTGESRTQSPPEYIAESVRTASKHFAAVCLEVYSLELDEYRELYKAGAEGVTMFQETYDRELYLELHPKGPKRNFEYRLEAPDRMAQAGFRQITLGALLGLAPWREEVPRLFAHLRRLEKNYPGVEYGLSFPRIRPVPGDPRSYNAISDRDLVKVIALARILFPRVGITLSTREDAVFRDHMLGLGITKMSAASSSCVGGYTPETRDDREGQFHIHDDRSVAAVRDMLVGQGFDPVFTDWRHIGNA